MKFMQRKRIKITTEARAKLLKLKRAGENFSDVILRHFPRRVETWRRDTATDAKRAIKAFRSGKLKSQSAESVITRLRKISKEDAADVAWLKKARRKPMRYRPLADYLAEKKVSVAKG
jgi:predicted CopG family antitoxin